MIRFASDAPQLPLWTAGRRTVGDQACYFRSAWEANYARYLEFLKQHGHIEAWEHEPQRFQFGGIKRGTRDYLPDFRVTVPGGSIEYHEVKGWMTPKSKTQLKRMKKYHPEVIMILIDAPRYKAIAKTAKHLCTGWE